MSELITGSVLSEVQQSLRDIFQQATSINFRVDLAEEIRKYDREINKQKTPAGLANGLITATTLTEIEAGLVTDFQTAAKNRNEENLIKLAKEIRKYEHDISKQAMAADKETKKSSAQKWASNLVKE